MSDRHPVAIISSGDIGTQPVLESAVRTRLSAASINASRLHPTGENLMEFGPRKTVGGHADLIVDVAVDLGAAEAR